MNPQETAAAIEVAESELRRLGLGRVRVRARAGKAWLEVPEADLGGVTAEPLRGEVLRAVRRAGFAKVAVDLDGT